jgi:hypothetical protein
MAVREEAEHPESRARPATGESLEGWVPVLGPDLTLAEVVELAFDYRGDTTVVKVDGTRVVGYVFNRDATVDQPFIQLFDEAGNGPVTIAYAEIANIAFTGRDTAAGSSWKAWLKRQAGRERTADLHPDPDRS